MYGKYVSGAKTIEKEKSRAQTTNGTATSATGSDISDWIDYTNIENVFFTLADIAKYRVKGASKAVPEFDVVDYGQEDYVFGNTNQDARHWNKYVLEAFEENYSVLEKLFNTEVTNASNSTINYIIISVVAVVLLVGIVIVRKKKKSI